MENEKKPLGANKGIVQWAITPPQSYFVYLIALFLVVALENASIALKSLHRLLGASGRFSFGSAALLRETLGVEPGSVTPFAAINDIIAP